MSTGKVHGSPKSHHTEEWFVGKMSREESESFLGEQCGDRDFIVRESTNRVQSQTRIKTTFGWGRGGLHSGMVLILGWSSFWDGLHYGMVFIMGWSSFWNNITLVSLLVLQWVNTFNTRLVACLQCVVKGCWMSSWIVLGINHWSRMEELQSSQPASPVMRPYHLILHFRHML